MNDDGIVVDIDSDNDVNGDDADDDVYDDVPAKDRLEGDSFMDTNRAVHLLIRSETFHDHIPGGKKGNLYFVINNETNQTKGKGKGVGWGRGKVHFLMIVEYGSSTGEVVLILITF